MSSSPRLPVQKTYKLFIAGAFPRSESGRVEPVLDRAGHTLGHASKASRKDLRDAVVAARKAFGPWSAATAYNRGQILYRAAEMLEARRPEFTQLLAQDSAREPFDPDREVTLAADRLVTFAGWADKFGQVLGGHNPVAGPYWNITTAEPLGVVAVVAPRSLPLLALTSLLAPVIVSGNAAVVVSPAFAPVVSSFGEVLATSDLPAGAVNLLTGSVEELLPFLSGHRDIDGLSAADLTPELATLARQGAAENLKRVRALGPSDFTSDNFDSCSHIEPFVDFKTAWHPVGS